MRGDREWGGIVVAFVNSGRGRGGGRGREREEDCQTDKISLLSPSNLYLTSLLDGGEKEEEKDNQRKLVFIFIFILFSFYSHFILIVVVRPTTP